MIITIIKLEIKTIIIGKYNIDRVLKNNCKIIINYNNRDIKGDCAYVKSKGKQTIKLKITLNK
jgi:hypothetical protein